MNATSYTARCRAIPLSLRAPNPHPSPPLQLDTTRETLARTEKRVRVMCHVSNLRIRATEATSEYHSLPLCFVWRSCARLQREQARRQIVANWRSACLKAASESSEPTRQLREEQAVVKKLEASLAESSTQH